MGAALARSKEIISKRLKLVRTSWMKAADTNREQIEAKAAKVRSWKGGAAAEICAAWDELLQRLSPTQALAFRNKGELSVEDKARILDEFAQLGEEDPPAS